MGVSVGIGGVFVIIAAVMVGVLVFIDIAGGGRFGVLVGGKGVNVGSEGLTIFGLGVLFVMGGVLRSAESFVELAVGV